MIFSPRMLALVLAGTKTQTRRKPTTHYQVGRSYAIQPGRGEPAVGRVLVKAVHAERLGDICDVDARAEGFSGRRDFLDYWQELHGEVDLAQEVTVVEFALVEGAR